MREIHRASIGATASHFRTIEIRNAVLAESFATADI
jgi:hypothetical protein